MTRALLSSLCSRAAVALLVGLATIGCAGTASAQRETLRAGLALSEVLSATGLQLEDVVVPSADAALVRVELRDGSGIAALVDVRVHPSIEAARDALAALAPSLSSRGVEPIAGLGDVALLDEASTIAAFARANVVVVVRTLTREALVTLDARALAVRLVAACDASPRGRPVTMSLDGVIPALQPGQSATIALPPGLVALRIEADGDATARRTADGWLVSRGPLPYSMSVRGVDALLRLAR